MASRLGYIPHHMKCTATNQQVATDGNVIYNAPAGFNVATTIAMNDLGVTMTPQQCLNGLLLVDAESSGTEALTLPTAALLVAAMPGVATNSSIRLVIRNTGGETVVLTASTGITLSGSTGNILTADTMEVLIIFSDVTPGNETAICYNISTTNIH